MYVRKEIKIDFTKAEEEAIQEMITLTSTLREECGDNCDKCPLDAFCGYKRNVNDVKESLIKFLEE